MPSSLQSTLLRWRSDKTRWCKNVSSWRCSWIRFCSQFDFEVRTDWEVPTARTLRTWSYWRQCTLFSLFEVVLLLCVSKVLIVWWALHSYIQGGVSMSIGRKTSVRRAHTKDKEWWCRLWRTWMLEVQREGTEQCRSLWMNWRGGRSTRLGLNIEG